MILRWLAVSLWVVWVSNGIGMARRWKEGPQVDPGVFVITHIRSCRNGAGYCILGIKCNVDTDFVDDDSGGNCDSLSAAFSPQATFVCCKENPVNFDTEQEELEAIILEQNLVTSTASTEEPSTTPVSKTSIITEIVTDLQTEFSTKVEEVTELYTELATQKITQDDYYPTTEAQSYKLDSSDLPSDYTDLETLLLG